MDFNDIIKNLIGDNASMVDKGDGLYGVRIVGHGYLIYPCTLAEFLAKLSDLTN